MRSVDVRHELDVLATLDVLLLFFCLKAKRFWRELFLQRAVSTRHLPLKQAVSCGPPCFCFMSTFSRAACTLGQLDTRPDCRRIMAVLVPGRDVWNGIRRFREFGGRNSGWSRSGIRKCPIPKMLLMYTLQDAKAAFPSHPWRSAAPG
jgi:hypothetical protein